MKPSASRLSVGLVGFLQEKTPASSEPRRAQVGFPENPPKSDHKPDQNPAAKAAAARPHACPSASLDGSRPLERYPRDWRAPMPLRPCSCGSRWYWLSPHGAIKCCACNPPANLSLAEAWVMARKRDGRIPAEILSLLHVASPPQ